MQTHTEISIVVSWSGIEAFFGIGSELTFRTSLLLSKYLSRESGGQLLTFKAAKKSYSTRSKIAHGSEVNRHGLDVAAKEVHDWLRQCLLNCVELGSLPREEALLFS